MASTRLRNSLGQYCIDQQREHTERQYLVYKGKKSPTDLFYLDLELTQAIWLVLIIIRFFQIIHLI